ncbi:D-alanyl-D-alanine carboxypeptidase family protein [Blautia sp. MSJ-19]|uniref:D-alanyl-D-alanine carboxypeptidase family protein n=1 Tax=Blautia sp. MSJ-19 TaxID=2841517 RepID=UPI00209E67A0|nr:D-alanyl-D-alanine carboxypeptidase family protein [Blautia sp. MSJ-19]
MNTANILAEPIEAVSPEISAPSGVLMEAESGQILYAKDKDTRRSPASVTKIMTLILIFDKIHDGSIQLNDTVTTSAHAKSMGGSQVFLEEGETQTVETLIKCIVIASGNDASVAMAEFISGSESEFVAQMNQRAASLGMKNTHFTDCCGLTDSDEHYTTAQDIAIMSRELIINYPEIFKYSSIWMENITHVTRQGSKEFGLTNTNRLIRTYPGCKGLKTGSTSKAGFCLSAVAEQKNLTLISVVMAAPDYKARLKDAATLLDYGFSHCSIYTDEQPDPLPDIPIRQGKISSVSLKYEKTFRYLSTDGTALTEIQKSYILPQSADAPVKKGDKAGEVIYSNGHKELGRVSVLYAQTVKKQTYPDCIREILYTFWF